MAQKSNGTENTLSDSGTYSDTAQIDAVIYAKDNMEIKGKGVLNINANVHHGITAKDSLEISSGTIENSLTIIGSPMSGSGMGGRGGMGGR